MSKKNPLGTRIGSMLRNARQAQQLTMTDVGNKMGHTEVFISYIERGFCIPTSWQIRRFLDAIGYRIHFINASYPLPTEKDFMEAARDDVWERHNRRIKPKGAARRTPKKENK